MKTEIKRYDMRAMKVRDGGLCFKAYECETGQWVKYDDIKHLFDNDLWNDILDKLPKDNQEITVYTIHDEVIRNVIYDKKNNIFINEYGPPYHGIHLIKYWK